MSVIQTPTSVPINNLPPPVTSGSGIQTFIDVNGEQWVAKNGVYSGVWKRARDVMHAVAYRNAAYTMTTSQVVFPYDVQRNDQYGMWTPASNGFTLGCPGWWLCQGTICGGTSAGSQYIQGSICYNGVGASSDNVIQSAATGLFWRTQCLLLMPAGTIINLQAYQNVANAVSVGIITHLEVMYLGSG